MNRDWREGAELGALYRITDSTDRGRVGCCWMAGRLRVGDTMLCVRHSGDCFYQYILVEVLGNGIRGIPQSEFGAYVFGDRVDLALTPEEIAALKNGQFVKRVQP